VVPSSRIRVAVDGSDLCDEPLRWAVRLARQDHTILTGFFVLDSGWADFIGNDWQSSRNARQGFLDYVGAHQLAQAERAARQFAAATGDLAAAGFETPTGEPLQVLRELARAPDTALLVLSRRVFQVSGRPRLRRLGQELVAGALRPLLLFP
jgi:nucleotide-binding universal stress UspA family protein